MARNSDRRAIELMRKIARLEAKGDHYGAQAVRTGLVRKEVKRTYTSNLKKLVALQDRLR